MVQEVGAVDLESLTRLVQERLRVAAPLEGAVPRRVSVFLRPIRKTAEGEESTGLLKRMLFTITSVEDLYQQVAENILLYTLGEEDAIFHDLPNVELRLLGKRASLALPGAPAPDNPDQIWLKVTVYAYTPSLWAQMFGRKTDA